MRLSNYMTMIDWDLRKALLAKEGINELFNARLQDRDAVLEILSAKEEKLREASILRAESCQVIGELQEERFTQDEDWEDWSYKH
ncbi:hypothetical protein [uncultured Roseovarius sp.]|uniref:hypothetical protein n=1 Tax=uncultured Roseovarius sp. TaxID=293344 RepID=UPI0025F6A4A7|nr:hypothetical protein [uncultured Roseovarius sp.]